MAVDAREARGTHADVRATSDERGVAAGVFARGIVLARALRARARLITARLAGKARLARAEPFVGGYAFVNGRVQAGATRAARIGIALVKIYFALVA